MKKDFLHINDLSNDELKELFDIAFWIKNKFKNNNYYSHIIFYDLRR